MPLLSLLSSVLRLVVVLLLNASSFTALSVHLLLVPLLMPFNLLSLEEEIELDSEGEDAEDYYDDIDGETESDEENMDSGIDELELKGGAISVTVSDESLKRELKRDGLKVPILTVKEKKELASYANGLGKKLKSQLVGKAGVTDNAFYFFRLKPLKLMSS